MSKVHDLKVHPDVWAPLWSRLKQWEFRKNDRDFKAGDRLRLRKINPKTGEPLPGPFNEMTVRVTYILHGPAFGVPDGYCIMSIK